LAALLGGPRRLRPAAAAALALLAAGIEVSYARSAWLGLAAASVLVILLLRWRALPLAAAAVVAVAIAAPAALRDRAMSIVSLERNRDRIEMLRVGARIVRQHPLLGVGPNQIPEAARKQFAWATP